MGHKFERARMERQVDGSVSIGLQIVATIDDTDRPDPDFHSSAQWARCSESHEHGWDECDIVGLFNARQMDGKGQEIAGTSLKEILEAWLSARRAEKDLDLSHVPLPTKKEQNEKGKEIDVPDRAISLDQSE